MQSGLGRLLMKKNIIFYLVGSRPSLTVPTSICPLYPVTVNQFALKGASSDAAVMNLLMSKPTRLDMALFMLAGTAKLAGCGNRS